MKNIFLVSLLSCVHSFVLGQHAKSVDSGKIKIFIIGVIHSENQFRNADSLLNILKDIKPDLILDEGDSTTSSFRRQYLLSKPPWWYSVGRKLRLLRKMPPEVEVLFKYKNIDENIKVLPFDEKTNNRKRFAKLYLKSERKWYSLLNSAFFKRVIPDSLTNVHETYMKYNNWLHNTFKNGYKEINNPRVIDSVKQFQIIEKKYIANLLDTSKLFSEFKSWYSIYNNFWFVRGKIMAENVIKTSEMTKSKKVVVFTGLLHKYYLIDLLNSYKSEQKYEIVEYFEQ